MSKEQNQPKMIKDALRPRSKLKRSEIVSLFNAFGRWVELNIEEIVRCMGMVQSKQKYVSFFITVQIIEQYKSAWRISQGDEVAVKWWIVREGVNDFKNSVNKRTCCFADAWIHIDLLYHRKIYTKRRLTQTSHRLTNWFNHLNSTPILMPIFN